MDPEKILLGVSDEDTISSDDEFCPYDAVDSLQHKPPPTYTQDEYRFLNSYTYDKESFEECQVSDFEVIKECNEVKWDDISELLGDCHGFININ